MTKIRLGEGIALGSFDLDEYFALLSLVSRNRNELLCSEVVESADSAWLFLRHDVDYSVECALKMSKEEAKRGHRSTYFFQLDCDYYNLLSSRYSGIPREISSMGHEVGLHYDVRALEQWGIDSLEAALETQLLTLSALVGSSVKSISMHNPSLYGTDPFSNMQGVVNAYNLTGDGIDYFSDSCGAWRDVTYAAFANGGLAERIQLLIHPIYWAEGRGNRWQRLNEWAAQRRATLNCDVAGVRDVWRNHQGVVEHDARSDTHV